ncbi:hypothetical protein ACLOJK_000815 [Asimina triloba]
MGGAACRRKWVGGRCSGRRWAALDGDEEATMGAASSGSEKKVRLARAETTPLDAGGGAAASIADGAGGSLTVADLTEEDDGGRSSSRSWLPVMGGASGSVGSGSVRCPRHFGRLGSSICTTVGELAAGSHGCRPW